MTTMGRNVTLPLPLVVAAVATLLISLLSHISAFSFSVHNARRGLANERIFPIPVRTATLTTVKSERFGLYANSSDWDSILPKGDGFIYHPDDGQHYLVAHYHNLHCLRSLRHYLNIAMVSDPEYRFNAMDKGHVDHCLIYLRQIALCNADLTLEPASHKQMTPDGKIADTVTGVGVMHRCTDWSQVWEYMEDNYEGYKDSYEP